jgi:hypothetical protein
MHVLVTTVAGGEGGGEDGVGGEDTCLLVLIPCGRLAAVGHLVAQAYTVLVTVSALLPGVLIVFKCESVPHGSLFVAVLVVIVVLIKCASIG